MDPVALLGARPSIEAVKSIQASSGRGASIGSSDIRCAVIGAGQTRHGAAAWTRSAIGRSRWLLLALSLIAVDQLTKALAPGSWVTVDAGSGTWTPAAVGRAFKGPVTGEILDGIGCALLVGAALATARVRATLPRTGVVVLLAGLTSNLIDRLGMAHITQSLEGRYVVNWFRFRVDRFQFGNIADLCYALGTGILVFAALARAARKARRPASPRAAEPAMAGQKGATGADGWTRTAA